MRTAFTLLGLVSILTAACAGGDVLSAPAADNQTAADSPATGERLWIKDGGQTQPLENGRSVTVNGVDVEIFVSPYPPGRTANMDFYVTRNGQTVEDANVSLQYDMTSMEHGPFRLLAVPTGRGHYLAPLDFRGAGMSGDFWINVSVDTGGKESVISMLLRAGR